LAPTSGCSTILQNVGTVGDSQQCHSCISGGKQIGRVAVFACLYSSSTRYTTHITNGHRYQSISQYLADYRHHIPAYNKLHITWWSRQTQYTNKSKLGVDSVKVHLHSIQTWGGQLKELAALPPQKRRLHTLFRKQGLPRPSLDALAKRYTYGSQNKYFKLHKEMSKSGTNLLLEFICFYFIFTVRAWVKSQGSLCGICGGKNCTGTGLFFTKNFLFPLANYHSTSAPLSSIIWDWYNRSI
jgi:hypothetical protein